MKIHPTVTTTAGVAMPRILYGTAWKKERTLPLVVQAVEAGFRGIDTACQPRHYSEALVGEALEQLAGRGIPRGDLFVQTKFTPAEGQDPASTPYDRDAPVAVQVAQSFTVSQKNLHSDYVDSLVLHSPLFPYARLAEAWGAMERIALAGDARQLGISNCYDLGMLQRLYADASVKPAVVQNRFYEESGYDAELRQWCDEHGIVYQSFWTLTANPHLLASDTVRELAARHGRTPAQIFFAYLSSCGIVPLSGTTSPEHMREDLATFEIALAPQEREAMARLFE